MAIELLRPHQDLFVYAHKRSSNVIFCYPSSKQLCKSIKPIQQFAFCWLLAVLISHTARHGLSACSGWVISCAGYAAQAISTWGGQQYFIDHKECFNCSIKYTLRNVYFIEQLKRNVYFIEQLKHSLWSIKYT